MPLSASQAVAPARLLQAVVKLETRCDDQRMNWGSLLSVVVGAVMALSGTLLADTRRDRTERARLRQQDRQRDSVAFSLALNGALNALRDVARSAVGGEERRRAAARAVNDAETYSARERLLITASAHLVAVADAAFHRLIDIRNVVREGADLDSAAYHHSYHAFAEALWAFRLAVRVDLGEAAIEPELLGLSDWSDGDRCAVCAGNRTSSVSEEEASAI
jgi:hypothetical protein